MYEDPADGSSNRIVAPQQVDSAVSLSGQARRCDQCGKPFGPKKHGGGSPRRFCTYDCRMAWHAAQRKPACTLVPKNSVSRSGQPPGNAPVNVPGGFARTQQKSRTLSEKLKTTMFRNGHGLVIRQSCNKQDDRWILISNASIDTFIETLAELAKDSSGESNAA
jgi:hypothetical protein